MKFNRNFSRISCLALSVVILAMSVITTPASATEVSPFSRVIRKANDACNVAERVNTNSAWAKCLKSIDGILKAVKKTGRPSLILEIEYITEISKSRAICKRAKMLNTPKAWKECKKVKDKIPSFKKEPDSQ